jgi:hypothetical protein
MKNRPIHENLDTSFVNLSALIKYLRRRQFVGQVKIQLNGYRAEIEFGEDNRMKVSEHDQISGRVSEGEEALQRLLIRAREPGGTINVYQAGKEKAAQAKTAQTPVEPVVEAKSSGPLKPFIPANGNGANGNSAAKTETNGNSQPAPRKPVAVEKKETGLPDFPFVLSNKVEEKAKQTGISDEDWQTVLRLTVELLGSVDRTLAGANLDFTAAFQKVRAEIAGDYPFLDPNAKKFEYAKGRIKLTEKINPKIFIASMTEVLRRILEKLESNPKFTEVHRRAVQTIIALMNKRKPSYDKFAMTPPLRRILGI